MSERTALYRMYDASGALLYIGISKNFGSRWRQHAAKQSWYPEVQRQTVDWYPGRPAAEAAEEAAISEERPRCNIIFNPGPVSPEAARRLRDLALHNRQDKQRRDASYAILVAGIWEAHDDGWQQVDIVREVGLTRERVRQITNPKYRARHDPGTGA